MGVLGHVPPRKICDFTSSEIDAIREVKACLYLFIYLLINNFFLGGGGGGTPKPP